MIINQDTTVHQLSSIYNELTSELSLREDELIIFSHYGFLSKDLVNSIACTIEELMYSSNEKKTVIKRMFSILIEGLQNIRAHSLNECNQLSLGFVVVSKTEDCYNVCFGNTIKEQSKKIIINNIDELNDLEGIDLKERYRQLLCNGLFSSKGGAGLGLITMKMKSDSEISYCFSQIDELLLAFTFCVNLKR